MLENFEVSVLVDAIRDKDMLVLLFFGNIMRKVVLRCEQGQQSHRLTSKSDNNAYSIG